MMHMLLRPAGAQMTHQHMVSLPRPAGAQELLQHLSNALSAQICKPGPQESVIVAQACRNPGEAVQHVAEAVAA